MKGLELARCYYEQFGRAALETYAHDVLPRVAIGLAGEGSECFGFDDAVSRDHDWGPSFCIWLDEADYHKYGARLQQIYDSLPKQAAGYPARRETELSGKRVGCLCTQQWYRYYTGYAAGPRTPAQWRRVPEAFLATATNGEVFYDPSGRFTAIRNRLKRFYPEDIRIKKIVARAAVMAQAGQYNYPRCVGRGDTVAAHIALSEFMKAAMSMVYLLNKQYAPYYKWMYRGLCGLPKLPRARSQFEKLMLTKGVERQEVIEGICLTVGAELRRQGLTDRTDTFLQALCADMMQRISDPELRNTHFLDE